MNRRHRARLALVAALTTLLSTAHAGDAPLQVRLRIVEACTPDAPPARTSCRNAHRHTADDAPPPPQVQALTPPDDDEERERRPWLTVTF